MDLSRPLFFDESSVRFEAPDMAVIVLGGRVAPETVHQFIVTVAAYARGKPYIFSLVDLSHLEGLSKETRLAAEQSQVQDMGRGLAFFGGSIALRIIAGSVLRLKRLLTGRLSHDPVCSFDTEAEARRWLAERRRQVRRELSLPDWPDPPDQRDSAPP